MNGYGPIAQNNLAHQITDKHLWYTLWQCKDNNSISLILIFRWLSLAIGSKLNQTMLDFAAWESKQMESERCYKVMTAHDIDIKLLRLEENRERTHLYRWEMMRYEATPVEVNLATEFAYHAGKNIVRLTLSARYTTLRGQISRRLLDYAITADFEINGAESEQMPEEIVVTPDIVRLMLSIAVGAMRGMVALRTERTFLANYPLPIYDMESLMEPIMNASHEAVSA